jgi:hypothetical protein
MGKADEVFDMLGSELEDYQRQMETLSPIGGN